MNVGSFTVHKGTNSAVFALFGHGEMTVNRALEFGAISTLFLQFTLSLLSGWFDLATADT